MGITLGRLALFLGLIGIWAYPQGYQTVANWFPPAISEWLSTYLGKTVLSVAIIVILIKSYDNHLKGKYED